MSHILEFLDLVDVPNTFSGYPSAYVKVNSGATALEFVAEGPFLPLTAGSGEPLTGDLYLDGATDPTIYLREGGQWTNYGMIKDTLDLLRIQHVDAGVSMIDLDAIASDNTSASTFRLFKNTNTSGSRELILYEGDGSATVQHSFNVGTGDVTLCQQGGDLYVNEGFLYVDKTASPYIQLREGGDSAERFTLSKTTSGGIAAILNYASAGTSLIRVDPFPSDGTGASIVQFFRTTSTSGSVELDIFRGDGSSDINHQFIGNGSVLLCKYAGNVVVDQGNLYLDKTADPTIFLREGASTTNYSSIKNTQANLLTIQHLTAAADSYIRIEPTVGDGTSAAYVQFFRGTDTTGVPSLKMYEGNDTTTIHHEFFTGSSGSINLCKEGGTVTVEEGNVFITKTGSPSLYVNDAGDAGDYLRLLDNGTTATVQKLAATGAAVLRLDAVVTDGTGAAYTEMFRLTNTSGSRQFNIWLGDGTATAQHTFDAGTGDVDLCQQGGQLSEGGDDVLTEGAAEFNAITVKSSPSGYDVILIEDQAGAGWAKKKVELGDLGPRSVGSYDESTAIGIGTVVDNWASVYIAVGTITVENNTGSTLNKGNICYISGDDTGVPEVTLADADAVSTGTKELVVIADTTIATANSGLAKREGLITGLSGFTANTIQYLSTTAGDTTETAPSGTGDIVRVIGYSRITTELMFTPSKSWVEIV